MTAAAPPAIIPTPLDRAIERLDADQARRLLLGVALALWPNLDPFGEDAEEDWDSDTPMEIAVHFDAILPPDWRVARSDIRVCATPGCVFSVPAHLAAAVWHCPMHEPFNPDNDLAPQCPDCGEVCEVIERTLTARARRILAITPDGWAAKYGEDDPTHGHEFAQDIEQNSRDTYACSECTFTTERLDDFYPAEDAPDEVAE